MTGLPDGLGLAVRSTRRLGKRFDEEGKVRKYRPILVHLAFQSYQEWAVNSNKELWEMNKKNKMMGNATYYRIDPDLTVEQMEHWKNMKEEAKLKSSNEKVFFVVGKTNPVLRWKKRPEMQDDI